MVEGAQDSASLPSGGLGAREALELMCFRNLIANTEERIFFKDSDGRYLFVSAGWLKSEAPGLQAEGVVGKTDVDIFSVEHADAAHEDELEIMRSGAPLVTKVERETFSDRVDAWISTTKLALRDANGAIVGTFGISRELPDHVKQLQETLTYHARHDPLTGLANRAELRERLAQALRGLERERGRVAIFFIDLDGFKTVNDTLGHDGGDQVLVETAQRLQRLARRSDIAARFGGDEFVLLCTALAPTADVRQIAHRIVRGLRIPPSRKQRGAGTKVSASVGAAWSDDPATDPDALLQRADQAMYAAKRAGRDCFHVAGDLERPTPSVRRRHARNPAIDS